MSTKNSPTPKIPTIGTRACTAGECINLMTNPDNSSSLTGRIRPDGTCGGGNCHARGSGNCLTLTSNSTSGSEIRCNDDISSDGQDSDNNGRSSENINNFTTIDRTPKIYNKGKSKGLFMNVQSSMPKMDLLQAILRTNKYDLVEINESWLDMKGRNCQAEIGLQGFRTFTIDKPSASKRGGGSVLYAKGNLRPILCRATATTTYEIIHVGIMPSEGITLKIVFVYGNPRITVA